MYQYKAKIDRWVDGDTVLVTVDLGFYAKHVARLRLARIDAHELNGETKYKRRMARSARFQADQMCPVGSEVIIETSKTKRDMYARYITEIIFEGKNISDELLRLKVVKKYKANKKE